MDSVREQPATGSTEATNVVKMDRQRPDAPASEAPAAKKAEGAPTPAAAVAAPAAPARKRSRARIVLPVLLLAALGGGGWYGYDWWTNGRFLVDTDDAYVQADMATLGIKVSGYVQSVPVQDGDSVKAGDVLVRLDDTDYRTALASAKAKRATQTATIERIAQQITAQQAAIDSAVAGVQSAQAGVDSANAGVDSAKAEVVRSDAAFARAKALETQNFGSKANLDQATADRDRAAAGVNTAKAAVANAQASVASAKAALTAAQANMAVVKAQKIEAEHTAEELDVAVARAQNDLDATVVRAPTDGIVGNRAAQPGQYVSPGSRLMALVPLASIYVAANFKETQLGPLAPGQKVEISVDAIDGKTFEGVVGKFSPASGSMFSLLPPENATGNFTKITQRVPVRIDVPADAATSGKLLPGMSVVVSVDSRTTPKN
ncbi:HlyD family secretion protein [Labrys monachus]|uniref:Membrane fusion protein (Multidrug efflux system) n=1 Tax=Labrys monachus TaxID=217067 RepID=A0ABU0F6G8_9HYPH|nr:HlyD family secretion protein [Labrys monachus]MDQ0390220.1 membrane fusion protein (multidrug efflux system) [Labrys monachus]